MNALRVLMAQHDRVEGLLVDISLAVGRDPEAQAAVLREFARALRRHFEVEERLFYAALRGRLILVREDRFLQEHYKVLELLATLEAAGFGEGFTERYEALHQTLVQHVSDEEIELFPEVKRRLSLDELDDLGERIEREVEGEPAIAEAPEAAEESPEPEASEEPH